MEKEVIFGAPSAHNASQNVSQILVQKQLFTSRFIVGRGEPIRYDNGTRNESNFKRTDLRVLVSPFGCVEKVCGRIEVRFDCHDGRHWNFRARRDAGGDTGGFGKRIAGLR